MWSEGYDDFTDFKICGFTKSQEPRYLEDETFSLQIKKSINYTSKTTLWQQNSFVAEVTLKAIDF